MLYTNLKHIENAEQFRNIIRENTHVVVICGRMGKMSIPVYRIAEELEQSYRHIKFFDMELDNPESQVILDLPEVKEQLGIPIVLYIKNGQIAKATTGTQTHEQISSILNEQMAMLT